MRTTFSRFDRVTIGNSSYQPLNCDAEVVQFMPLDGTGAVARFTYNQIDECRTSGDWRYERNFFALGENRTDAPAGWEPSRDPAP